MSQLFPHLNVVNRFKKQLFSLVAISYLVGPLLGSFSLVEAVTVAAAAKGDNEFSDIEKSSESDNLNTVTNVLSRDFTTQYTTEGLVTYYPTRKKSSSSTFDNNTLTDTIRETKDVSMNIPEIGDEISLMNADKYNEVYIFPLPKSTGIEGYPMRNGSKVLVIGKPTKQWKQGDSPRKKTVAEYKLLIESKMESHSFSHNSIDRDDYLPVKIILEASSSSSTTTSANYDDYVYYVKLKHCELKKKNDSKRNDKNYSTLTSDSTGKSSSTSSRSTTKPQGSSSDKSDTIRKTGGVLNFPQIGDEITLMNAESDKYNEVYIFQSPKSTQRHSHVLKNGTKVIVKGTPTKPLNGNLKSGVTYPTIDNMYTDGNNYLPIRIISSNISYNDESVYYVRIKHCNLLINTLATPVPSSSSTTEVENRQEPEHYDRSNYDLFNLEMRMQSPHNINFNTSNKLDVLKLDPNIRSEELTLLPNIIFNMSNASQKSLVIASENNKSAGRSLMEKLIYNGLNLNRTSWPIIIDNQLLVKFNVLASTVPETKYIKGLTTAEDVKFEVQFDPSIKFIANKKPGIISYSYLYVDDAIKSLSAIERNNGKIVSKYRQCMDQPGAVSDKIAVLNYVNAHSIGGNYSDGHFVQAQEESLMRHCPELFQSFINWSTNMEQVRKYNSRGAGEKNKSGLIGYGRGNMGAFGYTIERQKQGNRTNDAKLGLENTTGMLYTYPIILARYGNSPAENKHLSYQLLPKEKMVKNLGIISMAAPDYRFPDKEKYENNASKMFKDLKDSKFYETMWTNIFKIALENGHKKIIIGPIGVGAFLSSVPDNLADDITKHTVETAINLISKENLINKFEEIHFCLGEKNGKSVGNRNEKNIYIFKKALDDAVRKEKISGLAKREKI